MPSFGVDEYGNAETVLQRLDESYLYEGIAAGLLSLIGASGLFLIRYSSNYAYHPKHATIALIVGIGIITIAWFALSYMLIEKLGLLERTIN